MADIGKGGLFDDLTAGQKTKPDIFADLVPKAGAAPANPNAAPAPRRSLSDRMISDVADPTRAAAHQVMEDIRQGPKSKRHNQLGDLLAVPGAAAGGAFNAAARPLAELGAKLPMPGQAEPAGFMQSKVGPAPTQEEKVRTLQNALLTAAQGVGGEGNALEKAGGIPRPPPAPERPISAESPLPRPKIQDPITPRTSRRELAARSELPRDPTTEKPLSTAGAISQGVREGGRNVRSAFAASTMSDAAKDTANIVRRSGGESSAIHAQTANKLLAYDKVIGRLPVAQQRAMVDYIEGVGEAPANPELKAGADAIADAYKSHKARIEYVLDEGERPNFLENYYSHMWQEKPSVVLAKMNQFARQGSGRSFKARSIPTMREGIEAGLTPRSENPIEVTMAYSSNMQRFLHTLDVRSSMMKQGLASWHVPGQQPEGYVPLNGILTKQAARGILNQDEDVATLPEKQLYAPEDAARIYNRSISQGFDQGGTKPFYETARKTSNAMTALKLGLSGYHATAETLHASFSDVARGIVAASKGQPIKAAERIGAGLTPATSGIRSAFKGAKLRDEIVKADGFDNLSPTAKAYVQSGGRVKMDSLYSATDRRTFYQAIKNKTFGMELKRAYEKLYEGNTLDKVKQAGSIAANVLQSTMGPLFEDYIPNLKAGAFAQRYGDWLDQHPQASRGQQEQFARQLTDSMDNRFGEMIQDNLFWHKQLKQTAQILMLAPGWKLGLLREFVGGALDIPKSVLGTFKGEGVTDKTAYLTAALATAAFYNGVATYLKTGTAPQGKDFQAYRTGGQNAFGEDERAALPGQQKDIYAQVEAFNQFVHSGDPSFEVQSWKDAANPALSSTSSLLNNSNYRGDPVYPGYGVEKEPGDHDLLAGSLEDDLMPITMGNFRKPPGSRLSLPEKLAGAKAAPFYTADPAGYKDWIAGKNQRRYDSAQHYQDQAAQ